MPGIFGVIDRSPAAGAADERREIIRRMSDAMRYESEYVTDIVSSTSLGACVGRVGWKAGAAELRRAAPFSRSALVLTGEVSPGAGSAAPELASGISSRGVDALKDADGAFAGVLLDQDNDRCVLFNDRYGMERLFLYRDGERIYFSSEAKAILAVAASTRDLAPAGLAQWLSLGCTIGRQSLFQNIDVLDSGTAITFRPGHEPAFTRYFDRAMLEQLPPLPERDFVGEFGEALATAVNDSANRSPVALSLTGGIDSRLVLACLDSHTVPSYTFGSMYREPMDVLVARSVAARCGQPHQVLTLDKGFLDRFADYHRRAVYASDGYLGLAGSAELYLNQLARRVAPARMTGNWGGELMRGVRAFKFREPKGNFILTPIRDLLPEVAGTFARTTESHPLSFTLFNQMPNQAFGRYAIERSQVQMRAPFLANGVVNVLYRSSAATRGSMDVVRTLLAKRQGLAAIPTDIGLLGDGSPLVQSLRRGYRRMVVKAEYMTSHGAPDWMAAISKRVPALETAFLGRDKFQHFRYWMRHQLSDYVRDIVRRDDSMLASYFDMRQVSLMAEEHMAGRANYTDELDKVMSAAVLGRTMSAAMPVATPGDHAHHEMASIVSSPRRVAVQ
jgi:asparagine synthase (glutamine-hydrolysing)